MHSIVIFASGRGTNAQAIIDYFKVNGGARVSLIVSNKANAGVLDIAKAEHIPFLIIDKHTIKEPMFQEQLQEQKPSLIVLAGFMWKVPDAIIHSFSGKIVNIHPALLPSYGGKGMYGHHVHHAVLTDKQQESGITIHYINEVYDAGNIIVQARCAVHEHDTADSLAERVHKLEHYFYPRTIEYLLSEL